MIMHYLRGWCKAKRPDSNARIHGKYAQERQDAKQKTKEPRLKFL
jgi:hypothetical protein